MFDRNIFLQHTTNTTNHNKMTRAGVKAPFSVNEQMNKDSSSADWNDYDLDAAEKAHETARKNDPELQELKLDRDRGQQEFSDKIKTLQSQLWTRITPSDPRWDVKEHGPRLRPVYGKHNKRAAGIIHGTGEPINIMVNSAAIRNPNTGHIGPEIENINRQAQMHYENHPATKRENEIHREHDPLTFHSSSAGHEIISMARAVATGDMDKMRPHQLIPSIMGPGRSSLGEGEVEDIIRRHFKEFNNHPVHGRTVPYARFRKETYSYVKERRS